MMMHKTKQDLHQPQVLLLLSLLRVYLALNLLATSSQFTTFQKAVM